MPSSAALWAWIVSGASSAIAPAHAERGVEIAEPLHQPEPMRLVARQHLGRQQHRPSGTVTGQQRQAVDRPGVDRQTRAGPRGCRSGPRAWPPAGHRPRPAGCRPRAPRRRTAATVTYGALAEPDQDPREQGDEAVVLDAVEVRPGAEVAAGAGHDEHTGARGRTVERCRQRVERGKVKCVAAVGPVDRDEHDVAPYLDVEHGRNLPEASRRLIGRRTPDHKDGAV